MSTNANSLKLRYHFQLPLCVCECLCYLQVDILCCFIVQTCMPELVIQIQNTIQNNCLLLARASHSNTKYNTKQLFALGQSQSFKYKIQCKTQLFALGQSWSIKFKIQYKTQLFALGRSQSIKDKIQYTIVCSWPELVNQIQNTIQNNCLLLTRASHPNTKYNTKHNCLLLAGASQSNTKYNTKQLFCPWQFVRHTRQICKSTP